MKPTIMFATMVKDSERWLNKYWATIKNLNYPKSKIKVVFTYGESNDKTLKILKKIAKEKYYDIEVYEEPRDRSLRIGGAQLAASIYNDWKELLTEDYLLMIDSDVIEVPPNLLNELLKVKADIVAPYPWSENHRHFFDSWIFRITDARFHPNDPPGLGLKVPIIVDSVGTCFLSTKEAYLRTPINNPYPNLSFCNNATKLGYSVVACPYLEITHVDLEKLGILHHPLSMEYGGYPKPFFLTSEYKVTPYKKKRKKKETLEV